MDGDNGADPKPKRKRRTPEEIAAEKAAKEERRIEREALKAQKESEKAERAEQRRLKYGPFTIDEAKEKATEWIHHLPDTKSVRDRWIRAKEISPLTVNTEKLAGEIIGSKGEVYETSLVLKKGCTCPDFQYNGVICCKHQIALARHISGIDTPPFRLDSNQTSYSRPSYQKTEPFYNDWNNRDDDSIAELRRKAEIEEHEIAQKDFIATVKGVGIFILWLIIIFVVLIGGAVLLFKGCSG